MTLSVPQSDRSHVLMLVMRLFGLLTAASYLVVGTIVLWMLLIMGAWQGFSRPTFTAGVLLAVVYVYSTVWVGWRLWRQPRPRLALLLGMLLLPVLLEMGCAYRGHVPHSVDQLVATYATSEDPQDVETARQQLLEIGRRAGNPPQVRALLAHLEEAEDDDQRIHLMVLLGELSYQNQAVLDALNGWMAASRDDPQRQALYHAASRAASVVNPYAINSGQE